ncbi:MAG: 3-phosphoshikimate 1-carboxyvinyltransferase [Verrucomicrobiota bacterium]
MSHLKIHPLRSLKAELTISGDKSISHRAVIFGALAEGPTRLQNFLPSEDCLATLNAFQALGVEAEMVNETTVYIEGCGGKLLQCGEAIDCGNSGTTMRLLSGVLSGQPFSSKLQGDGSLHRRPMKRIADPLQRMGAQVICEGNDGRPPLQINGQFPLTAIDYLTPVPSAQIKSAILLAALQAKGMTVIEEKEQSRDHTERMLKKFGASVKRDGLSISLLGQQKLHGTDLMFPGDFSSAAFWIVAAAASPDSNIVLRNVGLNPTRTGLLNVLSRMGAQVQETVEDSDWEPIGKLTITGGQVLHGTVIEGKEIPNVIDEIPVIAVAAALASGETTIRDAAELRIKESDRLATVADMLRRFGVQVREFDDGMTIYGGGDLMGDHIDSHGDHRIAMAGAILGLFANGITRVHNVECIQTSYPAFPQHMKTMLADNPADRMSIASGISSKLISRSKDDSSSSQENLNQ